jgi:hypothetical protein
MPSAGGRGAPGVPSLEGDGTWARISDHCQAVAAGGITQDVLDLPTAWAHQCAASVFAGSSASCNRQPETAADFCLWPFTPAGPLNG